jgi:hypothetical protein
LSDVSWTSPQPCPRATSIARSIIRPPSPWPRWSDETRTPSICARSMPCLLSPGIMVSCSVPTMRPPASATSSWLRWSAAISSNAA